jgi:predicted acetyltransferase/8-oxo-dGTP pyrophosphatase MutT (NUDIX family)
MPPFTIGAFAIIFNDSGNVLLCHRRDMDIWNLPGGGVESGELPTEAVIREVKEETGLEVVIERLVGVYGKVDKDEFIFSFACRVISSQHSMTDESDAFHYFAMDDLPPNTPPKQVERIHDAIGSTNPPIFRYQSAPSTREMLAWNAHSDKIDLIEPNLGLQEDYLALLDEHRQAREDFFDDESARNDFSAFLNRLERESQGLDLSPGLVPATTCWLVKNDEMILGESRLRHSLTPALEHHGGHIGYIIRPSQRRKGYGTLILALTLEKARLLGIQHIRITCDSDNLGSARIIEKNGGMLSGQVKSERSGKIISQYWIHK